MVWYGMVWGEDGGLAWSHSKFYPKKSLLRNSASSLTHICAPLWGLRKYVLLVTHTGVATEVQQDPVCWLTIYRLLQLSMITSVT